MNEKYTEILAFLKEILAKELKVTAEEIDEGADLLSVIGADSLNIVELLMALEDKYGYYLPDSELIKMTTLSEIAEFAANNI